MLQEEGETELARKELGNVATEIEPAKDILRVKEISVSSVIVASESPYFLKLFCNGMKESGQNIVSMRVTEIEAEALEELIHYIYKEKFKRTDPHHLLNILVASDKYQVNKAAKFCVESMLNSEITTESAILYLNCPVALEAMEAVKLVARNFLVKNFYQVARNEETLLKMPLSAIRAIFGSSELVVLNEDYVFSFLLKWACENYPENERGFLFSRVLVNLIRFPHMSVKGLSIVGMCPLLTNKTQVIFIITNALLYKSNTSHRPVSHWNYHHRVYLRRPINVTALDPFAEIHAYMDINLHHLLVSKPGSNTIDSESFMFNGFRFTVRADTRFDPASNSPTSVGLFLVVHEFTRPTVNVQISFAVRRKPADEFFTTLQFNNSLVSGSKLGHDDGFKCPWAQLTGEESPYVIGGKIYIRVRVRVIL